MAFDYGTWIDGTWDPVRKVVVIRPQSGEEVFGLADLSARADHVEARGTRRWLIKGVDAVASVLVALATFPEALAYYLADDLGDDTQLRQMYRLAGVDLPADLTGKALVAYLWSEAQITDVRQRYARFAPRSSGADDQGFTGEGGTVVTRTLILPNGAVLNRIFKS